MPVTMHAASVPVFRQTLIALSGVLDKAAAHCAAKKIDPSVLLAGRLYPDMLAFARQIQIAADFAKGGAARLAGMEVPSYPDDEKTFDDLKARIAKTLAFLDTIPASAIDGSEAREVTIKIGGNPVTFLGQPYLLNFVLPNFFFHATTAYAILRESGVEIGKRDFIGPMPA
jgi:hypothetical protein